MGNTSREVVISTERVNCYGARVITMGIDIGQYRKNPVLLYMHQRYGRENMPIGRVDNIRVEGNRLLGTLVFDTGDPEAKRIADKWENGFLRMVSPSLEIMETSNAPELLQSGQTRPTVTRCKLVEVSVVDIGGNDDALRLQFEHGGKVLHLSAGEDCRVLPLLGLDNNNINEQNRQEQMKTIMLALGLSESANAEEAVTAINRLKERADKADNIELSAITGIVDAAINARKITADKKEHFINLGKKAGVEALNETLSFMLPAQKPTDFIDRKDGGQVKLKWSDLTPEKAEQLKATDPKKYAELYKEEFGESI